MLLNPRHAALILAPSPSNAFLVFLTYTRFYGRPHRKKVTNFSGFGSNVGDAVASFNSMLHMLPPPPIKEMNKVLGAIVRMEHYATVVSLCGQLELKGTIKPSVVTMSILVNCFPHLGQMGFAFSVVGKILKRGFELDRLTLTTLMKGLCMRGRTGEAMQLHNDSVARGFRFDEVCYGTLINGLCKTGKARAAVELMQKKEGLGVGPNLVMHNTVIDGFVTDACSLCSKMVARGILLDIVTYNSLIHGFYNVSQFQGAAKLLNEMVSVNIENHS